MTAKPLKEAKIKDIARKFFQIKGFMIRENIKLRGKSGQSYFFDMLLSQKEEETKRNIDLSNKLGYGVIVKDWKRSVGVNVIIKLDQTIEEIGLEGGIIVSNHFSGNARNFAKKCGIIAYSRGELVSLLRNMNIEEI